MKRAACAVIAMALVSVLVSACVRTSEGAPIAGGEGASQSTTARATKTIPTPQTDLTEPGVVPTTRTPVPAGSVTCTAPNPPPVGVTAAIDDPVAPKITVALPDGWSTTKGKTDQGAVLDGPDGVSATVTIAKTKLDPAEAFEEYADDVMAVSSVSSVSVLPADLCGYSGQKLLGSWADSPQQAIKFGDRIAHIWTNSGNYLVAVHVEGPADAPGFDPMLSPLMDDFAISIP
jgi:hypothetical protein